MIFCVSKGERKRISSRCWEQSL